jgi:hypothetical protein
VGHVVHSGASGTRNVNASFFMLGWDWHGVHQKCAGTRYFELVFLHPVGSAGYIEHFGASRTRNVKALFFMLGWDQYGFQKKERRITLRRTCVFVSVGYMGHIVHSGHETSTLFFKLG